MKRGRADEGSPSAAAAAAAASSAVADDASREVDGDAGGASGSGASPPAAAPPPSVVPLGRAMSSLALEEEVESQKRPRMQFRDADEVADDLRRRVWSGESFGVGLRATFEVCDVSVANRGVRRCDLARARPLSPPSIIRIIPCSACAEASLPCVGSL
jgi:hypothetical protein